MKTAFPRRSTASATADIRRVRFACKSCGENTDAPPNTSRFERQLCRRCFGKRKDRRPRELNALSGAQWARCSKSIETYPDVRSEKQRAHGACFPKSLALQQIQIFTRAGQTVLDPFVGVGTTLDAALELRRNGIGIDLNSSFIRIAKTDLSQSRAPRLQFRLLTGDARRLTKHIAAESVDFVLTSPPYATLLKAVKGSFAYKWREHSTLNPIANPKPYSTKPSDIGNMPYVDSLSAIRQVMEQCYHVLKNQCYAVWVIKDYRDLKHDVPYVNFHGDVIAAAQAAAFTLWDIRIYDQTKFRPLVCLGYPSRNFYLNIGHSYLLTFKKER